MLFKLSLRNIRRSLRDYAVYFFTLIIGVSVFYVFNAIGSQAAMLQINDDSRQIVELLKTMLSGVSVFVAGVLGLLIVYASRFLMKRRNKEFALYLMLGMGKGKISAILLLETIMIGIGSLAVGLVIGIGLSQLMSALVASLFEADMTAYKFSISGEAIVKTILYFAVMYLVVMLFNSGTVSRLKLIDLINSGKRSEQIRLKHPAACVIVFLLAAALLGYAYNRVAYHASDIREGKEMAMYIAMGAVSTFLIFWSVSGMLLRIVMSVKPFYFRGLNSFTFRQIASRVGTMVFSMTVICLMLFVTICTLSASFSMRNSMNANFQELCPADYELSVRTEEPFEGMDFVTECRENGFDILAYTGESVRFQTCSDPDFTFQAFLGTQYDAVHEAYPSLVYNWAFELVRLSDYNALMALYGREPLTLEENEFILLCDFKSAKSVMDDVLSKGYPIEVLGQTLSSRYDECQDGFIDISAQHLNAGLFVVPDSVLEGHLPTGDYLIGNYKAADKAGKMETEKAVRYDFSEQLLAHYSDLSFAQDGVLLNFETKLDIASAAAGLGAIITFLGLYIGLVFLIACGAILALKELSESVDSIPRYEMLRKIGAEESDISRSLFRQTGIFFLLPLLLACLHSVFGMKFAVFFLEVFGTEKMGISIAATSVMILVIYGGYFLITYVCSKGIIRERQ